MCKYFRDITWTLTSGANNITSQVVHCVCPAGSVAYIVQHEPIETETGSGYKYSFACSPESVSNYLVAFRMRARSWAAAENGSRTLRSQLLANV